MKTYTRHIRSACGIWLLVVCLLSFPWGLVYSAPVLLAYGVTRRRSWCSQAAVAVGCLSLVFMGYCLIRYACWKSAGNYDAQEAIGLLFIAVWQYAISMAAMTLTWLFCAGYRNMTQYNEKK